MTGTEHQSSYPARAAQRPSSAEPSAWTGWIVFAGILMVMMGAYQAIVGFVAIFNDSYYLVRPAGLVVHVDYTAWGWVHLFLGLVAFFAGFGVMSGRTWARAVGIVIALVSAVVNFAFIAAFPLWAAILITVDILVIYALAAHGREMQAV